MQQWKYFMSELCSCLTYFMSELCTTPTYFMSELCQPRWQILVKTCIVAAGLCKHLDDIVLHIYTSTLPNPDIAVE